MTRRQKVRLEPPVQVLQALLDQRSEIKADRLLCLFMTLDPAHPAVCRYTIDWRTDMDRVFNVHAGNGSVYVLRELDREENAWHNISVMATEFSKSTPTAVRRG